MFALSTLYRCGVSATVATDAAGGGSAAVSSHYEPLKRAAAGRRPSGGVPGPDTHHPQSPASCLSATLRDTPHTHSGQIGLRDPDLVSPLVHFTLIFDNCTLGNLNLSALFLGDF